MNCQHENRYQEPCECECSIMVEYCSDCGEFLGPVPEIFPEEEW